MKWRVVSGLLLTLVTLLPVSGRSQEQPSHAYCPPLPEQRAAGQVALYVAKALDAPGILCVRAINGISPAIGLGGPPFFLQRWEEGTFQNFSPGGAPQADVLIGWELAAGKTLDRELFVGQPVSPGRYRVCLRYDVGQGGEGQIACSEEIALP